jgi:alcohol dehydrogenase class IV
LIAFSVFISIIVSSIFYACSSIIPEFYNTTESVKNTAKYLIQICAITMPLDAFAHAVEGFFSPKCTEYPEVYARLSIPMIYKCLKALLNEKALPSKEVRDELFLGSLYAGLELNVCGAAFPHTVGYILTEEFSVPHGKACAALMPRLLMKAKRNSVERFHEFLRLCGENEVKVIETIKALADVKISATDEQLNEWCSRWGDVKNFHNTPGDFTNEEAVEALKELR